MLSPVSPLKIQKPQLHLPPNLHAGSQNTASRYVASSVLNQLLEFQQHHKHFLSRFSSVLQLIILHL